VPSEVRYVNVNLNSVVEGAEAGLEAVAAVADSNALEIDGGRSAGLGGMETGRVGENSE
jgi:hypothetical protein